MNITIASKLMELYAACPKCGCEVIGNGKGLLECDTAAGFFKRSCGCGWHVEVTEVITEGSMPEDTPELPAEDEDEPEPVAFANPEPEPAPKPFLNPNLCWNQRRSDRGMGSYISVARLATRNPRPA